MARAGRGWQLARPVVDGGQLLELEKSGIHVATYWTEVLPKAELERKLHEAIRLARERLARGAVHETSRPDSAVGAPRPKRKSGRPAKLK